MTQMAALDRSAWLEMRREAIGASDVSAILGCSPYRSAWDVWAEKTGRLKPWDGNEATRIGQLLESSVLGFAEEVVGECRRNVRVARVGKPIVSTLDAITTEGVPVEVKTAGMVGPLVGDWGAAGTDEIPEHYLCQVHTQILCTGAEMAFLFALLAGRGIVQYEIARSDKLCEAIESQLCEWWDRYVVADVEPSRDLATMDVVKRLRKMPNKVVVMDDNIDDLLSQRAELKAQAKHIEEQIEEIDKRLLLGLGDAEEGICVSGSRVTFYEQHRKGFAVEPTSFRVLRVKNPKVKQ